MKKRRRGTNPLVSIWRNRNRHPYERMPHWLNDLADEVWYWLRKTSRLRHSEPFNKRKQGKERRQARRFKRAKQEELMAMEFNWQDRRGDTFMLNVPGVGMFFLCRLSKGKSAPYVTYLDSKLLTDPIYRGKLDDVKAACERHAVAGK